MRLELEWNGDSQCVEHSEESSEGEANGHHALHLHLVRQQEDKICQTGQTRHIIPLSGLDLHFLTSPLFSLDIKIHNFFRKPARMVCT